MSTATRITSYQEGCIERVKRAKGPDVWVFRWREVNEDGRRVQRKQVIGGLDRYPTKSDAKRAVENLRAEINARHRRIGVTTVAEAWGHFENCELRDPEVDRCQSTIDNYLVLFKAHIIPRWGNTPLDEVEAVDVERWLRGLKSTFRPGSNSTLPKTEPRPLAPASKAKIKSRMYSLYEHARRHKLCDVNPIETVRQGAKRVNKPAVLTLEEIRTMMLEIGGPGRDRTDDLFHAMEARSQTAPQAHVLRMQLFYSLCWGGIRQCAAPALASIVDRPVTITARPSAKRASRLVNISAPAAAAKG
jgi:integrase